MEVHNVVAQIAKNLNANHNTQNKKETKPPNKPRNYPIQNDSPLHMQYPLKIDLHRWRLDLRSTTNIMTKVGINIHLGHRQGAIGAILGGAQHYTKITTIGGGMERVLQDSTYPTPIPQRMYRKKGRRGRARKKKKMRQFNSGIFNQEFSSRRRK